jgi:hypothetical protein
MINIWQAVPRPGWPKKREFRLPPIGEAGHTFIEIAETPEHGCTF